MEAETLLSPLPLQRLQPFRHSVGRPALPLCCLHPTVQGEAAQLSPSAGSGRVAGFTSFPAAEDEAAPTLLTLICTLSLLPAGLSCALTSPLCPWSVIPLEAGLAPRTLLIRGLEASCLTPAPGTLQCLLIPGVLPWTWKQLPLEIPLEMHPCASF